MYCVAVEKKVWSKAVMFMLTAGSQSTLPGTTPFVAMALIEIAVNIVWINHE